MEPDALDRLEKLISCAKALCHECESLSKIDGSKKLLKKCNAELMFLEKLVSNSGLLKQCHINSTNLYHLQGIFAVAAKLSNVTHVLRHFSTPSSKDGVIVDVICHHGQTWIKVIARNSKALDYDIADRQQFGTKSIIAHAQQYKDLAAHHPYNFEPPQTWFVFCNDVPTNVGKALEAIGVRAVSMENLPTSQRSGTVSLPHDASLDCSSNVGFTESNTDEFTGSDISSPMNVVNLDITTLILLISNLSNGHCQFTFSDPILSQQAAEERSEPSMPRLLQFLNGKRLFVCDTALQDFRSILDAVGGPEERSRYQRLMDQVTVVADSPSARSLTLARSARIKQRAVTIFGTGDSIRAVTTTANSSFVRASLQAGVEFVTFLHPARALTERKEATAQVCVSQATMNS